MTLQRPPPLMRIFRPPSAAMIREVAEMFLATLAIVTASANNVDVPLSGKAVLGANVDVAYFAQHQVDALVAAGVDVSGVEACRDRPTGTAFVMVAPSGENAIVVD